METASKIRIYSKGEIYRHGMPLKPALSMLHSVASVYDFCIDRYTNIFTKGQVFYYRPQISLEYIKKGSLSSIFTVDFPAAYVMIAPLIAGNAWNLFKNTIEFAQLYIGLSKKEKRSFPMSVSNSPNSTNNFFYLNAEGDNNNIIIGKDLSDSFRHNGRELSKTASFIGNDGAKFIDIQKMQLGSRKIEDGLRIDISNNSDMIIEEEEVFVNEELTYPCRIYSFNVKTKKGRLDIVRDNSSASSESGAVSFEVQGGILDDYVDAMKADLVQVVAKSRLRVNSIGESKITHLYPVSISI